MKLPWDSLSSWSSPPFERWLLLCIARFIAFVNFFRVSARLFSEDVRIIVFQINTLLPPSSSSLPCFSQFYFKKVLQLRHLFAHYLICLTQPVKNWGHPKWIPRIQQKMKRPSMLKSERRRSLSPSDKGERNKRVGIRKCFKMYVPHSRIEKLKVEKIPLSVPDKLVIVSNYEGNGFRQHQMDIAQFNVSYEVKKEIYKSLKKLNKETYKGWAEKKTPLESKKFQLEKCLLYFEMLLVLALSLILIVIDQFRSINSTACTVTLITTIMLIVIGAVVIGFSSLTKKYSQNSLQTDIKNIIVKNLQQFNQQFYLAHNLIWKVNIDFLWVSLNKKNGEGDYLPSEDSHSQYHNRRDTEEYLHK